MLFLAEKKSQQIMITRLISHIYQIITTTTTRLSSKFANFAVLVVAASYQFYSS
jgi:hypothetical protein